MIILLMGVAGAGKTTVGVALAQALRWRFVDGDDYHSAPNVAKMRAGIPLTDADRAPWLQSLRSSITTWLAAAENVVLACSALKAAYRDVLLINADVKLVYLKGSRDLFAARLASRRGHYMNPALLGSQFDDLQEPRNAVTIDAALPTEQIVAKIRAALVL